MPSIALKEFLEELGRTRCLVQLEVKVASDPPKQEQQVLANSLRAGAAVLMVASFESYLSDLSSECVDSLASSKKKIAFDKLNDKIRVANIYGTLEFAMKGPRHGSPNVGKTSRLPEVQNAATIVANKILNPIVFGHSQGNPNQENVKKVFRDVGYENIFAGCKARFERYWKAPVASRYIGQNLDTIVSRRHAVAHGDSALTISRQDLRHALKFLRVLGTVLDIEMRQHFRGLARSAKV